MAGQEGLFRDNVYFSAVLGGAWLLLHWSTYLEPHHTVNLPHFQALDHTLATLSGAAFTSSDIPVAALFPYIQVLVALPVALHALWMSLSGDNANRPAWYTLLGTIPQQLDGASLVGLGMCVGTCIMAVLCMLHALLPAIVKTVLLFGGGLFYSLKVSWLIVAWAHTTSSTDKVEWSNVPLAARMASYLGPLGLWVFLGAGLLLLGPV